MNSSNQSDERVARRERLLRFLSPLPARIRERLEFLKSDGIGNRNRDDFLWYFLLTSFATMGNVRGYFGLIGDPENFASLGYDAIKQLSNDERQATVERGLRKAKIRMPSKKTDWLCAAFSRIEKMGGLSSANKVATKLKGQRAKIDFLKSFDGIGDKYARNIWMDVYDPDFHESIAIDIRIKSISAELGVALLDYEAHERFFQLLAAEAGLEPWELDRTMFWFKDEVIAAIRGSDARSKSQQRTNTPPCSSM